MSQLTASLVEYLAIESALDEELEQIPDLLPKQVADQALEGHRETASEYIRQLAQSGAPIEPASKVVALKWRHGRRTVAALPLFDRVIYRAVVNSLAPDLEERVRGKDHFDAFKTAPLDHANTKYVVMTDLSNYYASIDLDSLAQELLARSGQWAQVDWLRHFWQVTSDGYGGIPQVNSTSDVVAETYAAKLHRSLLRKGLDVWRYADDFRIACSSYGGCVEALETMDEAARELGLTLNERKTLTPSIARYRDIVEGPQRRLSAINEQVEAELTAFDPYDWVPDTPEEAEVLVASSARILEHWASGLGGEPNSEAVDLTPALPRALAVMGITERSDGLPYVHQLLRYEPQYTPAVARYIVQLSPGAEGRIRETVTECLNGLTLTRWQHLWLLHAMEDVPVDPNDALTHWMRRQAANPLVPLQSQAVWTLARNQNLDLDDWARVDAQGSRYAAGFAAASLAGIRSVCEDRKRQLSHSGKLEKVIYEWSTSTYFEPTF